MSGERDEKLYRLLSSLNIEYQETEHKAVYTIAESEALDKHLNGLACKNLFLHDKKKNYVMITAIADRELDLKAIARAFGFSRLSFASEEELKNILRLERGSVTPLGLIRDEEHLVKLLIDKELQEERLILHPNTNTRSLSMNCQDLLRLLQETHVLYHFF